ncbi:hypothetical protein D3C72_1119890 [compost metagenome]
MEKRSTEIKKQDVLNELSQCFGVVTIACRKARIGRTQFYEWLKIDSTFNFHVSELQQTFVDFVECQLHNMIQSGDRTAIMFYLKAKAKDRGYK